ncbi:hypothetical protein [Psychrobacter sp. PAMC 21119]|uniref:hypothetical protein n=1 Tax=Psychrobacter sp. PAMC 21119 TaxID=1112209 RepID=UPI000289C4C8|nr:hypothetical protein [Psychrobacter sp. PAMC 21119]
MPKKTELITYNLANRDRKHNGIDRSDMDIRSAINHINSPGVQELVNSGDLFGYYGHEIRARFGMNPPDSWIGPNGETIRIEPAIRTIKLSADNDGNVSAKHEFLDTDSGKYSRNLYLGKAGGFSSAITRKRGNAGMYDVTGFHGFDYVRQPNYNTNRGNALFDSLFIEGEEGELCFDSITNVTPQQAAIKSALETAILHQYDNINGAISAQAMIEHYQNEAAQAQDAYLTRQQNLERLRTRRGDREDEILDGLICQSTSFDSVQAEWDSFAFDSTSDQDLKTALSAAEEQAERLELAERRDRRSIFSRLRR